MTLAAVTTAATHRCGMGEDERLKDEQQKDERRQDWHRQRRTTTAATHRCEMGEDERLKDERRKDRYRQRRRKDAVRKDASESSSRGIGAVDEPHGGGRRRFRSALG